MRLTGCPEILGFSERQDPFSPWDQPSKEHVTPEGKLYAAALSHYERGMPEAALSAVMTLSRVAGSALVYALLALNSVIELEQRFPETD